MRKKNSLPPLQCIVSPFFVQSAKPMLGMVFAALLSVLCVGCGDDPAQEFPTNPVRIAVLYPLSGLDSSTGRDLEAGASLAVELINSKNALNFPLAASIGLPSHGGRNVELEILDTKNSPEYAAKLVEKIAAENKAVAFFGCYSSAVTAAASRKAEMLGIPFLNPDSTSPTLTRRGFRWFFRTTPDDTMFVDNFFTFLQDMEKKLGAKPGNSIGLVYENSLWGTGVSREEMKKGLANGYDIACDVPYDAKAAHFEDSLQTIQNATPDIIMQSSYVRDAIALMQGYKKRGVLPKAILAMDAGFIDPLFLQTLGADAEFVFSREVFSLDLANKKPLVREIAALFRRKTGFEMTGNSARAFTGIVVLADALNRANTLSPEDIKLSLMATQIPPEQIIMPWDGVAFDAHTGQNTLGKGVIVQYLDEAYRIVWPKSLATAETVWPMPPWGARADSPAPVDENAAHLAERKNRSPNAAP